MLYTLALLTLAGAAAVQAASPSTSAPAGCSQNYAGTFEITVVTPPTKRSLRKRAPPLLLTLQNGVLTDSIGRTGYIASNHQLQFNNPPQTNAIYTSGWSACSNGSIALGDQVLFFQCLSDNFYNLYDQAIGGQCNPVEIEIIPGTTTTGATSAAASSAAASATTAATLPPASSSASVTAVVPPVSQISDGQIQATTAAVIPVSQISDGQIQATTPIAPMTPSHSPFPSPVPASQISDGQVQVTTPGAPVYTGAANKAGPVIGAVIAAAAFAL